MIGDEINCLKNVGPLQLKEAKSYCNFFNSSQVLPRSRQESNDLVSALLSLDLSLEDGKVLVSIGIHKTMEGEWLDSAGQLSTGYHFNWLPNKPDNLGGNQSYAGFRVDGLDTTARWDTYNGTDELNVVCTKTAGHGKDYSLLSIS